MPPVSPEPSQATVPSCAYGLTLVGGLLSAPSPALQPAPPDLDWPRVSLEWEPPLPAPPPPGIGDDVAVVRLLAGGYLTMDRHAQSAVFHTPTPPSGHDLAHPGLAPVGAVFGRWLDRSGFHAGAAVIDAGAWAFIGRKGMGKSTTLAWLASTGREVLTDDVLILNGRSAFTGPRCVDLRPEAAQHLADALPLIHVRQGQRDRVVLGPVRPEVELRGWVILQEADRVEVRTVPPSERIAAIAQHQVVRMAPPDPKALVDLASLPVVRLCRPLRWDCLEEGVLRLLERLSS